MQINCHNCKKELKLPPCRVRRAKKNYCSQQCKGLNYRKINQSFENGIIVNGHKVILDKEDIEKALKQWWTLWKGKRNKKPYVRTERRGQKRDDRKWLLLHRYVLDYEGPDYIDHINGDTLDCRKNNLRVVNKTQNCWNIRDNRTGRQTGVYKDGKRWRAQITVNKKKINIGSFASYDEARNARIKSEIINFKEYSPHYENNKKTY